MIKIKEFILDTWKDEEEINKFIKEIADNGNELSNILYSKSDKKSGILIIYDEVG